jgi:hypothetical protein
MVPPTSQVQRYTGMETPGGLAVLAKSHFQHGPKATNPPPVTAAPLTPPGAGIYDASGKLPQIQGAGLEFLAYA